jgi:DNA-binding response OmpR family regulator
VAEDGPEMGAALEQGLREQGYFVDLVASGSKALAQANQSPYDLLILDWMLPDRNGLEVVREIRARGADTPVLMLTAKTAIEDRVQGLDAGADDYLVKPFSFAELLARVRALVRRGGEAAAPILEVGDLRLDPRGRTVERAGRRIELSTALFNLLHFLMRNAGQTVSRQMILENVWNSELDNFTNVVDVYISRLRQKIDRGFDRPMIHTHRGVGFALVAE